MLANVFDITSCFRLSPPWGGRPKWKLTQYVKINFNPRPPWGGRLVLDNEDLQLDFISIHALRGEGDFNQARLMTLMRISIHALRGEGDRYCQEG